MFLLRSYPRITDWLYDFSGLDLRFIPIYSYGFFVALGFLVAAVIAAWEMRRRERLGLFNYIEREEVSGEAPTIKDAVIYFAVGFFILFKLVFIYFNQELFSSNPQHVIFSMQGNWIAGIIGGAAWAGFMWYSKKKAQLPEPERKKIKIYPSDQIGDLVVLAAVLGILGANLFNFIDNPEEWDDFVRDPAGSLFSGLSVFGGLIVAGIGFAIFAYVRKIHFLHLFDSVAPGYIMANGIGRIGCHVSGDGDWGIENTLPKPSWIPEFLWRNDYAHNIIQEGKPIPGCEGPYCTYLDPPVFPTPLYEFAECALICGILLLLRKKVTHLPGMIFSIFMVLNGIQRYTIELIRVNIKSTYLGIEMTQSQFISINLILIGFVGMAAVYFYFRNKQPQIPVGYVHPNS